MTQKDRQIRHIYYGFHTVASAVSSFNLHHSATGCSDIYSKTFLSLMHMLCKWSIVQIN